MKTSIRGLRPFVLLDLATRFVSLGDFTDRTGLQSADLVAAADEAISRGWVATTAAQQFVATELGYQFLDSTVATFL